MTDQDRNILSNQKLILGFLRAASGCLRSGHIPPAQFTKKKQKLAKDSDEDDDEPVDAEEASNLITVYRGTVLITLRNVAPYTLWYAPPVLYNFLYLMLFSGIYQNSRRIRLHPHLGTLATNSSDRSPFIGRCGRDTSTA
jgi:hypothetical protein